MAKYDSLPNVLVDIGMTSRVAYIQPTGLDGLPTTSASIKSDIESIVGGTVYFLEGTYTIDATIEPNSNTKIIGLGDVQLDWGGGAAGTMFSNNSADYVDYINLFFARTGNPYLVYIDGDNCRMINCQERDGGVTFRIYGDHTTLVDSTFSYPVRLHAEKNTIFRGCKFVGSFGSIYIIYESNDLLIEGCHWVNAGSICVYFGADTYNCKITHCTLEPRLNTDQCIEVADSAITINDLEVDHCKFKDAADAYLVPATPTVARWILANNDYDSITTTYNFLGTPLAFDFSKDGRHR